MTADMSKTFAIPLQHGKAFPTLPASGFRAEADLAGIVGVHVIEHEGLAFGPRPSLYASLGFTTHRNIYRIPLP
jgi:hypothetical protein